MSRAILWPRHEVLQLVLPVFSNCGKPLGNKSVLEAARRLIKIENFEGLVR